MKNFYKIAGIIAGVAFGVGLVCLLIGVAGGAAGRIILTNNGYKVADDMERWQYSSMDEEPFTSINIEAELAEIHILESETDKYVVSFDLAGTEEEGTFTNENGVLTIKDKASEERFTINIFGGMSSNKSTDAIYISVPKGMKLEDISIDSNVGDVEIKLPDGANNLEVSADVGEIRIEGGIYGYVELAADVGDIETEDIEVTGKINASADVGAVRLEGNLACSMDISADVGSVTIKTTVPATQYRYDVSADMGEIEVFGSKYSGAGNSVDGNADGEYLIVVDASLGSVEIKSVGK